MLIFVTRDAATTCMYCTEYFNEYALPGEKKNNGQGSVRTVGWVSQNRSSGVWPKRKKISALSQTLPETLDFATDFPLNLIPDIPAFNPNLIYVGDKIS